MERERIRPPLYCSASARKSRAKRPQRLLDEVVGHQIMLDQKMPVGPLVGQRHRAQLTRRAWSPA